MNVCKYIHSGVLFSHKEELNYVICRKKWMKLEFMLSKISQIEKGKYHMLLLICGI
jgi:hypothetical protein